MIKRVEIVVSSNVKAVDKDIDGLLARLANLEKPRTIKISLDGLAAVKTGLSEIKGMADAVSKTPYDLNFRIDPLGVATQLVSLRAAAATAGASAGKDFGAAFTTAAAAGMAMATAAESKAEGAVAAAAGGKAGGGGGGGGPLVPILDIFGLGPKGRRGVFGTVALFGGVGAISGLHLMAQGILEITATLLPATIAMAAFGIAGSDAAVTIFHHFSDLHTVMDATGRAIYPMTGALEALHRAAAPAVYQILGDAITIMQSKTGEFTKVALGAGHALDQLFARATVALTSSGMSTFLKSAVADLYKWGTVIGNIFGIVGNLLKALPGYAGIILNSLVGLTHGIEVLTGQPLVQWLFRVGLGLHGFLVYTGLIATGIFGLMPVIGRLVTGLSGVNKAATATGALDSNASIFAKMKAGLSDVVSNTPLVIGRIRSVGDAAYAAGGKTGFMARAASLATTGLGTLGRVLPIAGLAFLGLAIVGVVEKLHGADNATAQWIQTMQAGLQAGPITKLLPQIHSDIAAINNELDKSPSKAFLITPAVSPGGPKFGGNPFSNFVQGATHDWQEFVSVLGIGQSKFGELNAAFKQFSNQGLQVSGFVLQPLAKEFGGNANAMGLMASAGITSKQALDAAAAAAKGNFGPLLALRQQVEGTANAMKAMGAQGGILGNDLQVLDRQITPNYTAIQQVNQGWDTFIGNATATQGTFDTFASGMRTVDRAARGLHTTIDGLTNRDIALNQAFTQQVTNANGLIDTWRQAGLSGVYFQNGVKGAVGELLKFAKGSPEALAMLTALAQEAGYGGSATFPALQSWVGKTSDALGKMKEAANRATIQESLLSSAMHSQGNYIANQLISDINQATLKYYGVQKAAEAYGNAIAKDGQQSEQARQARQNLINDIIAAGRASHDTTDKIAAMITKILGIPKNRAISIVEEGKGHFSIQGLYVPPGQGGRTATSLLNPTAMGGYVNVGTTPTADDVVARVSRGELIVPAHMVRAGLVDHLRGNIPGFAAGGMVGFNFGQSAVNFDSTFQSQLTSSMERAMTVALASAMSFAGGAGGPSGASAVAAANYARSLLGRFGWGSSQFAALNAVAMAESGWNMFARNPSSGAYGIAQFIQGPSEYYSYGGNPNTIAGQVIAFMNYIRARYGTPSAAWAHEAAFHWYHDGLNNAVFSRPTLIGVGDGGPEMVNITPMAGRVGGYAAGGGGNVYISVAVQGDTDPDAAALRIVQKLRKYKMHHGNLALGIG